MKSNYQFKLIPIFSTIVIILFLSFNNQKNDTRLKLLIWQTPKISLGTYIAISTSSGFALSYLINYILTRPRYQQLKKKSENDIKKIDDDMLFKNDNYDSPLSENTLFERDINDPLPTINASFRIISNNKDLNIKYHENKEYSEYENKVFTNYDDQLNNKENIDKYSTDNNLKPNDWEDESYKSW